MGSYKGLQLIVQPTDSEHRGFFEEARQHRLVVQRCESCGMLRGAIGAACPFCTSLDWSWHPVSGKGEIYSYQIVTQAVQPAFVDWVPYPVVLVELDEQRDVPWRGGAEDETVSLRVVANLCQPPTRWCPKPRRTWRSASGSRSASSTSMTPWRCRSSG